MLSLFTLFGLNHSPQYPETHFRFKFPYSRLFKKRPEVLIDGPSRIEEGQKWPSWVIIRNADRFPCLLKKVNFIAFNGKTKRHYEWHFREHFNNAFHFLELPEISLPPGEWEIKSQLTFENLDLRDPQQFYTYDRWNLPGLEPTPIYVQSLQSKHPKPEGWVAGEHHCHTTWTSDPVEFGASPEVFQKSAQVMGLDYVMLTDHSYNFEYDTIKYMEPCSAHKKWEALKKKVQTLNKPDRPLLVSGEEVSCGNSNGENIHFLVNGCPKFIHGQGDGGRKGFNNEPTNSIKQVIHLSTPQISPECAEDEKHNNLCFRAAAHPSVKIGLLEKLIFNRGAWDFEDIVEGVHGFQFLNGSLNDSFWDGRDLWIKALLNNKRIKPIAGNDAHGDLNTTTGVAIPLFKLKQSHNHLFGSCRTYVKKAKNKDGLDWSNLQESLISSDICASTGPFISIEVVDGFAVVKAKSILEFGTWDNITVFCGSKLEPIETPLSQFQKIPSQNQEVLEAGLFEYQIEEIDIPVGTLYIRVEGNSSVKTDILGKDQKHIAISSAIFEL